MSSLFAPTFLPDPDEVNRQRLESEKVSLLTGKEIPWNVILGCAGVPASPVCVDCTALDQNRRLLRSIGRADDDEAIRQMRVYDYAIDSLPGTWRPEPAHIQVAPGSDLFHPHLPESLIDRVLLVMQAHPQHTFFIVTRFAERMKVILGRRARGVVPQESVRLLPPGVRVKWPLDNVWVGVACESQRSYFSRVTHLMETPAVRRMLVLEPIIERISIDRVPLETRDILWPLSGIVQAYGGMSAEGKPFWEPEDQPLAMVSKINWVVAGGFHGSELHPLHPAWLALIRKSCTDAGIPFFFKGWGTYAPEPRPDFDGDASLVILNRKGEMRGRGVGSSTNYLSFKPREGEVCMTRNVPEALRDQFLGRKHQEIPSFKVTRKTTMLETSSKAREIQRFIDTQSAMRAFQELPPNPEPEDSKPESLVARLKAVANTPITIRRK